MFGADLSNMVLALLVLKASCSMSLEHQPDELLQSTYIANVARLTAHLI